MKKLPNKISTEDLLKALDSELPEQVSNEIDVFNYRNDVPQFLSQYKIESGEFLVNKNLLFRLYKRFSPTPVDSHRFKLSTCEFVNFTKKCFLINIPTQTIQNLLNEKDKRGWVRYSPSHPKVRQHFEEFLQSVGLKSGNRWCQVFILKYIYEKWCRENKKTIRFKEKTFAKIMGLYFESKRSATIWSWFKIDPSVLAYLNQEDKEKIRNGRKIKKIRQ